MNRIELVFALVIFGCGTVHAAFIDIITGADMVDMEVTATFADGSTETATWVAISMDAAVPDGEGFSGGATGTGWSLQQRGFSLSNFCDVPTCPSLTVLGEWTLVNNSGKSMSSLLINAIAGGVLFDLGLPTTNDPGTPGSNTGRDWTPDPTSGPIPSASYGNSFSLWDLWGDLTLTWEPNALFAVGSELRFLADTDKISVPAPLLLLLLGGLGLRMRSLNWHC